MRATCHANRILLHLVALTTNIWLTSIKHEA